ncbi:CmcJ/NvfI family oxidoreductase [Variovorax saccharolyticus]|uniref:CmcJ/NvfI family oxidoreductase n=1 Tax=Variovorax saccharolyticus TaxID=3053516 RepID=UPI0025759487|nr:CmcJ/NvfI family oxidoreductase [Variovorax sp. J31P216]MDM0025565.1 CmcJ/NvfI family oxidoreductase [Variovorax sp. J31P216]
MSAVLNPWPGAATIPAVKAELNYLAPGVARPVSYTFEPPAGVPWSTGDIRPQRVTIQDGRALAALGELALDRSGFSPLAHRSSVTDFSDDALIRDRYYAESAELLRAETGAEKVVVFDHTLRDSANGSRATRSLREPVQRVHNDQTLVSGPRRVRDHLPADEAAERLQHRFAIINLWRPLATVERLPLALCDARSIAPSDLVPSDLVYPDKVGETYSFLHNPEHRWYWFPRLRSDEALLLKIYDSREDGTARLTAHTAFDLPDTPADAAPRRSIELRALVFWSSEAA